MRNASKKSAEVPANFKITYNGNGGVTETGNTMSVKYVPYNANLKTVGFTDFKKAGFIISGVELVKLNIKKKYKTVKVKVKTKNGKTKIKKKKKLIKSKTITKITQNRKDDKTVLRVLWKSAPPTPPLLPKPPVTAANNILDLTAYNITNGSVILNVNTMHALSCDGFDIYRSPVSSSGINGWELIRTLPSSYFSNDPTYTVVNAESGRPLYYKVIAWRYTDETKTQKIYSNEGNVCYAASHPGKSIITNIDKILTSGGFTTKIYIQNKYCGGYKVYRAEGLAGSFALIKTLKINGTPEEKPVIEGGVDNDEYVTWEGDEVLNGALYRYKVVPFENAYGIDVDGVESEEFEVR